MATNCICVYTFAPLLSYFLGQYSMNSCVSHTLKQNDTGRAQRLVTVNILHYKKAQWPLTPKQTVAHTGTQSRILSVCVRAACARWWAKSRTRSLINGLAAELGAAGGEWAGEQEAWLRCVWGDDRQAEIWGETAAPGPDSCTVLTTCVGTFDGRMKRADAHVCEDFEIQSAS